MTLNSFSPICIPFTIGPLPQIWSLISKNALHGIRFSRKPLIESPENSLNHELIALKSSQKDLGIIISNNLKWSPHITNIVGNQIIHLTNMKCRRSLYLALVRAHLCYGSELWVSHDNQHQRTYLLRIEGVQRRASKYVFQDYVELNIWLVFNPTYSWLICT
jgi:hypothetical protein